MDRGREESLKRWLEGTSVTTSISTPPRVAISAFEEYLWMFVRAWADFENVKLDIPHPPCIAYEKDRELFCAYALPDGRHIHVWYSEDRKPENRIRTYTVVRVSFVKVEAPERPPEPEGAPCYRLRVGEAGSGTSA